MGQTRVASYRCMMYAPKLELQPVCVCLPVHKSASQPAIHALLPRYWANPGSVAQGRVCCSGDSHIGLVPHRAGQARSCPALCSLQASDKCWSAAGGWATRGDGDPDAPVYHDRPARQVAGPVCSLRQAPRQVSHLARLYPRLCLCADLEALQAAESRSCMCNDVDNAASARRCTNPLRCSACSRGF